MAKQFVAIASFTLVEKTPEQKTHSCKAGQICSFKKGSALAEMALERGLIIEETIPGKAPGQKKAPIEIEGLGEKNGTDRK